MKKHKLKVVIVVCNLSQRIFVPSFHYFQYSFAEEGYSSQMKLLQILAPTVRDQCINGPSLLA